MIEKLIGEKILWLDLHSLKLAVIQFILVPLWESTRWSAIFHASISIATLEGDLLSLSTPSRTEFSFKFTQHKPSWKCYHTVHSIYSCSNYNFSCILQCTLQHKWITMLLTGKIKTCSWRKRTSVSTALVARTWQPVDRGRWNISQAVSLVVRYPSSLYHHHHHHHHPLQGLHCDGIYVVSTSV